MQNSTHDTLFLSGFFCGLLNLRWLQNSFGVFPFSSSDERMFCKVEWKIHIWCVTTKNQFLSKVFYKKSWVKKYFKRNQPWLSLLNQQYHIAIQSTLKFAKETTRPLSVSRRKAAMLAIARICQRQLAQSLFSIQENTRILDCHKLCVWLIKGSKQMIYNTLKQNIGLPTVWTTPHYKHWGLGEAGYEGLEINLYYSFHRSINMLVSNCLHKLLTLAQRTRFVHEQAWIAPWMSTSIDKPSFLSVVISFSAVRASDKFRWRPLIVHCWRHWSNKNAGLSSVYSAVTIAGRLIVCH